MSDTPILPPVLTSEQQLHITAKALVAELEPIIKVAKIVKWFVATVISIFLVVASIAIWVNNVNASAVAAKKSMDEHEFKQEARDKEMQAWKENQDKLMIRVITVEENMTKVLDRHQDFIDKHGPPSRMAADINQPSDKKETK